jgi:Heterokaryon incompatibility protein (HET)
VTLNLLNALKRLRLPSEIRWLLVDHLCIAQYDDDGKKHQVQLMEQKYATAEKVVLWVGDDDLDMPLLEEMFSEISPNTSKVFDISRMYLADELALKDLVSLDRPGAGPGWSSKRETRSRATLFEQGLV